jgi:glycosyltransferase involved in cell wall biosynthesis
MKNVWVLDHYDRSRHEEFAQLNKDKYQTIRFMSAFLHNKENSDNRTRVEPTEYGRRISVRTMPYSGNNWRRSANMVSFCLQVILKSFRAPKPDVVVASSPHIFTLAAGIVVSRLRRAPLVVEVRDFWPRSLVELGGLGEGSLMTRLLYRLEKWAYQAAKGIIFVMPHGRRYLEEVGIDRESTVIPNGIRRALVDADLSVKVPERDRYPFLAVYAGLLGTANNVDVILDTAKLLEREEPGRFGILIYGNGPEQQHLAQRIEAEGISNLHLKEPVSRAEVIGILRGSADATLFTLKPVDVFRYGISPNKISDYLSSGKPMLFSCRAANDIAVEARCGISVEPGDAQAMAAALIQLDKMGPNGRKAMGDRGFRYLQEHYIIEDHADRFAEFVTGI